MAVSQVYELDGVTIGSTEISVISGTSSLQTNTTPGLYQLYLTQGETPAKNDYFRVRYYEKVQLTGGTKRLLFSQIIRGTNNRNFVFPPMMLMNGWDMTIQKVSGADRAFDARIQKLATCTEFAELDNVTVDGSGIYVTTGTSSAGTQTEDGSFQLFVDINSAANADLFEVQAYEKTEADGGTSRVFWQSKIGPLVSGSCIWASPIFTLMHGWDFRLIKTAGTDRGVDASLRRVL